MIHFWAKLWIKDYEKITEPRVRRAYGILCGSVGIFLNICLFIGKFLAGSLCASVSIMADAFNSLSDAGSSLVTMIGFKLAGTKPDAEHPFGHGRLEYISGLIVSGIILFMALELVKSSIKKMIHPQNVEYSIVALVILVISIVVKLYMCIYNWNIGRKLNSAAMHATALDSFSDGCATTVVLIAAIISKRTGLQIDGYCGVLVSLFLFWAGVRAAKETLNPLLGQPPEAEFVEQVIKIVMSYSDVCGVHDLIVHDYGPGRKMISLHAEVSSEGELLKIHDTIDNIEGQLRKDLNCDAVIHMDPIVISEKQ